MKNEKWRMENGGMEKWSDGVLELWREKMEDGKWRMEILKLWDWRFGIGSMLPSIRCYAGQGFGIWSILAVFICRGL